MDSSLTCATCTRASALRRAPSSSLHLTAAPSSQAAELLVAGPLHRCTAVHTSPLRILDAPFPCLHLIALPAPPPTHTQPKSQAAELLVHGPLYVSAPHTLRSISSPPPEPSSQPSLPPRPPCSQAAELLVDGQRVDVHHCVQPAAGQGMGGHGAWAGHARHTYVTHTARVRHIS